jgi:cytochrome c-type biogenesis protein CcmH/NrfG
MYSSYNAKRIHHHLSRGILLPFLLGGILLTGLVGQASSQGRSRRRPAARPAAASLAQLEAAVRARPQDPAAHHALGLARLRAGQIPAALESLQQALTLDPRRVETLVALAEAREQLGDLSAAREAYVRAIDLRRSPHGPRHPPLPHATA